MSYQKKVIKKAAQDESKSQTNFILVKRNAKETIESEETEEKVSFESKARHDFYIKLRKLYS